MKLLHTLFVLLLTTCLVMQQAGAQVSSARIDSIARHALATFTVAGAAVCVVHNGETVISKGYGTTAVNGGTPVNERTAFGIASLSKAFTTAALAQLVDQGKLRWTDPVRTYIPEFTMYNPYVAEHFTIADLLTHRSGLPLGAGDLMFFPDGGDFTMADVLGCFQHFEPVSAFRTQFDYDNLLYVVAGEVVARISGLTFEEYLNTHLFKPLGLDDAFAPVGPYGKRANAALPHHNDGGTLRTLPELQHHISTAAGGLHLSASDLAKWMNVQLAKGTYGADKHLFSAEQQEEMWRIHTVLPVDNRPQYRTHFRGYGLGWVLYDLNGYKVVEHTGGLPGTLCKIMLLPDLNVGIAVLTNTSDDGAGVFRAVTQAITDAYIHSAPYDWAAHYHGRMLARATEAGKVVDGTWQKVKEQVALPVDHKKYTGMYEDPWFGKVEVMVKDGMLWMHCHRSPKLSGSMHYYDANTFAVRWNYRDQECDVFAMFTLDEKGKATGVSMKGISPEMDFSFDFHHLRLQRVDKD